MLRQIKRDKFGVLTLGNDNLHCGEVLQVLVPTDYEGAELVETRLEMADEWFFAGLRDVDVAGCFAQRA